MFYPSKSEFLELAGKGNLAPVRLEVLADTETPLTAYQKLTRRQPSNSFILESVEGGEHLGRYSFIGLRPRLVMSVLDRKLIVDFNGTRRESEAPADPLRAVEQELAHYQAVEVPGLPRFTGGMVGYIGSEYMSCIEPVPHPLRDDLHLPLMHFMLTDTLVIFDRVRQVIQIVANAHIRDDPTAAYQEACERIASVERALSEPLTFPAIALPPQPPPVQFQSNMPKDEYLDMVLTGKRYIKQGDIFQFVPSQRFSAPTKAAPLQIYRALRTINPSPYMFLMQLPDFALVGSSPEIHVRCENGNAEIRPIAGTRPRGNTDAEDLRLEKELLSDAKERAEHLMLVDLARNDLGRVCDFHSVSVPQFMTVERYSHVMHIVSQVVGKVHTDKTPFELMRATFPAGTLSGAPKIRAMQIISELEKRCRGPYGGALGYFGFNGNLDTCITIRTLIIKDGMAHVQAGGGVVDDSTPENEYQETVNKAKALVKAVALAESFS
ncbi:MAG: anthranilate synthase component I [Verrucomicrobia bacterium]|nr:anthranilate synthase component I [Verrucomicrobiota bacterium]